MRIVVISDTHGNGRALRQAVLDQPQASAVIYLGDGVREAQETAQEFADLPFYLVRGNCDFRAVGEDIPVTRLEKLGGKRILCTHGHAYEVKYGLTRAVFAAREQATSRWRAVPAASTPQAATASMTSTSARSIRRCLSLSPWTTAAI